MAESDQQKLGQYTLLEKIAQGGMAQVFKAKTVDPQGTPRLVVIKRILPHISSNPEYVKMLIDEAKVAVHFTHGAVAQVYDLGRIGDDYFIVMEYVDGKTLSLIGKQLAARNLRFPIDVLVYAFIETCHGLHYVHKKTGPDGKNLGVVHRDVSPQNILLTYAGNVKIIDFGVAKAEFREEKTESGVLKGKFAYMSPEQAEGAVIDHRSDIFSLGTLLWEMTTGERLFKRNNNPETLKAVQKARFDSILATRPDAPSVLDDILKRALQRKPKHRYRDAGEMAVDLEKLLFSLTPDFKPIFAAQFLNQLFSDQQDEDALGPELFPQDVKRPIPVKEASGRSQSSGLGDTPIPQPEEVTQKETVEHGTPIVRMMSERGLPLMWLTLFVALIFVSGTLFTYLAHQRNKGALLSLTGLVPAMEVSIDDQRLSPVPDPIKIISGRPYKIRVSQKDYIDLVQVIRLKPKEHKVMNVKLHQTKPLLGDLTILSTPTGATVYIDGMEWRGKTPVTIRHLTAGRKYTISLFKNNYRFESREIEIVGGKLTKTDNILEVNYATVTIKSRPAKAKVAFNQQEVGFTPFKSTMLMPDGEIEVTLTAEGFKPYKTTLKLPAGSQKSLDIVLEPEPEPTINPATATDPALVITPAPKVL